MKTAKSTSFLLITILSSVFSTGLFADKFYKWVDENGTTHYGSKPSPNHKSNEVRTTGRASGPASQMAPKNEPSKQENTISSTEGTVAYDAEELKTYCNSLKDRLNLMISSNQIKQRNTDGSVVMLKEEERQSQISDIKSKLADTCN